MFNGLHMVASLLLVLFMTYLIMFKLDDAIDLFVKTLKNFKTIKKLIILILSLLVLGMILFGFYYYNK